MKWHNDGTRCDDVLQDHVIVVFEVATQQVLARLEGHTATIRDIFLHPTLEVLVSTGWIELEGCRVWS